MAQFSPVFARTANIIELACKMASFPKNINMDDIVDYALAHPVPVLVAAAIGLGSLAFCLAPAQKEDVDVAPARPAARVSKPAPVKQAAPAAAPVNKKPAPAAAPAKPVQHSVPAQPAVTAKPAAAPAHASNAPAKQVAATKPAPVAPAAKSAPPAAPAVSFSGFQHDDDDDEGWGEVGQKKKEKAPAAKSTTGHVSATTAASAASSSVRPASKQTKSQITASDYGEPVAEEDDGWTTVVHRKRKVNQDEDDAE